MANPLTSKSLLAKARDCSDQSAWRRLTELYEPLIERWVRPHVAQRADAEDLVQEVMTTLVRELPRFDHNHRPGAFRAWLRTITIHRLRAYWEKRDARPAAAGGSEPGEALDQLADPGQRSVAGRGMKSTTGTSPRPCSRRSGSSFSRRPGGPSSARSGRPFGFGGRGGAGPFGKRRLDCQVTCPQKVTGKSSRPGRCFLRGRERIRRLASLSFMSVVS